MSRKNHVLVDEIAISPVYLSARSAIIAPERAISVTNYSLTKWLPRLGADRWTLVQLLRGLCIDAPRRPDGTKRVTISWRMLAERMQVHEETIASWLKHEVIPDDKPWRRIIPMDDYSEYLSLFIPRLRYAYETKNGKTRRVGFLLEVLMEDPVSPEDEIKLAQQVERLRLPQGELGLDTYRVVQDVNPSNTNLQKLPVPPKASVNELAVGSQATGNSNRTRFTVNQVSRGDPDSLVAVKHIHIGSGVDVTGADVDLQGSKSNLIASNVNKLESYINKLKKYKHRKRNYQQLLEPIVTFTETLLDDYHSTAMLYKVAKVLFPNHMDIYVNAVERALLTHSLDDTINRGAMFVKTVRGLADEAGIDLGFRNAAKNMQPALTNELEKMTPPSSQLEVPVEDVIWSETLSVLRGQMTKAMFDGVMRGTQLMGVDNGVYVIKVATDMARDWLDNRLKNVVQRALTSVIGSSVEIEFQI